MKINKITGGRHIATLSREEAINNARCLSVYRSIQRYSKQLLRQIRGAKFHTLINSTRVNSSVYVKLKHSKAIYWTTMPSCQAFNCTNESGRCKKSFFQIPNPDKNAESRRMCKIWINNLKNGKLSLETFKASRNKVVCEDHFTPDCFERNLVAESLNFFPKKKRLCPNAVPTLVNTSVTKHGKCIKSTKKDERATSRSQQRKRERAQVCIV